ncbi:MAG TPA: DUF5946 family protein [Roseiflexaceae bacterium]|jgi:hypothetical protein
MKTSYEQAVTLQEQWTQAGHPPDICRCCGAHVPNGVQGCFELYTQLSVQPVAQAAPPAASTYRVNAHALQHPEIHGKTNNAAHLLWLCWLFEYDGDADLPGGPPWWQRNPKRSEVPTLVAPDFRGALTVVDVARAPSPNEHLMLAEQWARAVYHAWQAHHDWARREIQRRWAP